jgi:hypothetical protein
MAVTAREIASKVELTGGVRQRTSAALFAASFIAFCIVAASLVSQWPIQLSIATVFAFAGPHNWIEFRFFLGRMPLVWGKSKRFYSTALGGLAILTIAYLALYLPAGSWYMSGAGLAVSTALWNTAAIIWIAALIHLRGRERRQDRSWIFAAGFALSAIVWLVPFWFNLGLVYLHPLIALWFLDRELKRRLPDLRSAYHICLGVMAAIVVLMWLGLSSSPNLSDSDALSWRITQHAGGGFLPGVSSHLLVATHVFLETVHYGAWIVLIPMIGLTSPLWKTSRIPLASTAQGWPRLTGAALIAGLFVVLVLWVSFGVNYATTRDVYFTFAMAHVLAEAPFLIRLM